MKTHLEVKNALAKRKFVYSLAQEFCEHLNKTGVKFHVAISRFDSWYFRVFSPVDPEKYLGTVRISTHESAYPATDFVAQYYSGINWNRHKHGSISGASLWNKVAFNTGLKTYIPRTFWLSKDLLNSRRFTY